MFIYYIILNYIIFKRLNMKYSFWVYNVYIYYIKLNYNVYLLVLLNKLSDKYTRLKRLHNALKNSS